MDRIFGLLQRLQRDIENKVTSTQGPALEHLYVPDLTQINDSVYSLHCPAEGKRPSVEIVLFHGLQLEGSHDAYITSWVSRSQSNPELWMKWILEDEKLEDARILLMSYDAHVRRTNEEGRMDMHTTSENLILDLIDNAQVGQDGCPVILVGHCLGGLLMKELCVQAQVRVGLRSQDNINNGVQNFLANVQGFFCYGSPHHGTELANISTFSKGPLFRGLTTLNDEAARRNENFRTLRQQYEWRTFGVGETVKVNLGRFEDLLVEEASARHDMDVYRTEAADHFNVCRPQSRNSSIFLMLKNFVSEVVEKDKSRQGPTMKISDFGLEPQLNEIRHKLFIMGVKRLGIVGMGGIGKTTLAKVVFNAILGYFDYTCFLMEVKKKNSDSLRDEIRGSLCFRGRPVNGTFKWSDLKGKRVLIVLDDITDESHVQVITEDENFLSSQNCTIIVTARDAGFLSPEDFECHSVRELDYENSKKLFCKYAFKEAKPQYESLVKIFLEKCDGLPLAIEVAGKYVYKKPEKVWFESLEKLGSRPLRGNTTDKLTSIVNMSYDDLAEIEQGMFLDVAHCFHGQRLSTVKQVWQICGCEGYESGWKNLLDKGLVTEVTEPKWWEYAEGDSRSVIQMHELLRDLGLSKPCPDPRSGSSTSQGNPPILKIGVNKMPIVIFEEGENFNFRNLFLDTGRLSGEGPHTSKFLKVKHLHRWISSLFKSWREAVQTLEIMECKYLVFLPWSLGQLQSLEHLKIVNCADLQAVPESLGLLLNLKDLTIQDCGSLSALPESLGDLESLQRLMIHGCVSLDTLPESLWRLGVLEYLAIEECHSLKALPLSLGLLRALKELKISECFHLRTLPRTIGGLQALQHLMIQGCRNLKALPKSLGKLRELEYLTIEECSGLKALPLNLGELLVLKHMKISDCRSLHTLPESISLLPALQRLTLLECHSLESLPKSLGQLQSLQRLTLEGCWNLVSLPESLWQLRGLQQLTIKCCHALESLLWTFGFEYPKHVTIQECERLRFLPYGWPGALDRQLECDVTIEGCPMIEDLRAQKHLTKQCQNLEYLPVSIGNLPDLEHLTIQKCQCLKKLPNSIGHLRSLQQLTIERCYSLMALPASLGHLRSLQHLTIERCCSLMSLPESLGLLPGLRQITISSCQGLESFLKGLRHAPTKECKRRRFLPLRCTVIIDGCTIEGCPTDDLPKSIDKLRAQTEPTIRDCHGEDLRGLTLESIGDLRALQHLTITPYLLSENLPESIGNLGGLEHLTIQDCLLSEHLPESIENLRVSQHLAMEDCSRLRSLPEFIGDLRALKHLTIRYCLHLEHLSESIGNLGALEHLTIKDCSRLKSLPESIGDLRALEHLTIEGCSSLRSLPESIGELRALEHLTIEGCSNLRSLPESIGDLGALKHLAIIHCRLAEYLPESIGNLGALEHLTIKDSSRLKSLPESIGDLRAVEHLTIEGCRMLESLPESIGDLRALKHLTTRYCFHLEHLQESIGILGALERLTVEGCYSLRSLPESIRDLRALKHLTIRYCFHLEHLPESIGNLGALEHLTIEGCISLRSLPESIGGFRALEHLTIEACSRLSSLPESIGDLRALKHLTILYCFHLEHLPESIENLGALEHLTIKGCSRSLRSLPESIGGLRDLKHVTGQ